MPCIIPGSYGPSGFPGAPGFPGMERGQRKEALFKGLESKEAEDSLATSVLLRGFSATEETAAGDCGVGRRDSGRPAKRGGLLTKHHKYSLSLPFPPLSALVFQALKELGASLEFQASLALMEVKEGPEVRG